jgi:hypothetical protein
LLGILKRSATFCTGSNTFGGADALVLGMLAVAVELAAADDFACEILNGTEYFVGWAAVTCLG